MVLYLHNTPSPPTGDTTSQADLAMNEAQPAATTLYNYDTDRDNDPGLRLRKVRKGGELGTTNPIEFQDWLSPIFPDTATIDGRASLFLAGAADNFTDDSLVVFTAWLLDHNPAGGADQMIVSQSFIGFNSTTTWSDIAMHFRPTVYTLRAGHRLRLKLPVDGVSATVAGFVAYDAVDFLSLLLVPLQPGDLPEPDFSDVSTGGTTSGSIIDDGGLTLDIVDLPNPAGFQIDASGGGAGTATIVACDTTIFLTDGDSVEITCGSLIIKVLAGPVEVRATAEVTIDVPPGVEAVIDRGSGCVVGIMHDSGPATPLSVRVGSGRSSLTVTVSAAGIVNVTKRGSQEFAVAASADRLGTVVVVKEGVSLEFAAGTQLGSGPHGAKQIALQRLRAYESLGDDVGTASGAIADSLAPGFWLSDDSLDRSSGPNVFLLERIAVEALTVASTMEGLSSGDLDAFAAVTAALVEADRGLAREALDTSLATSAKDPDVVRQVERELDRARDDVVAGDRERDASVADEAITRYSDVWEHAQRALDLQSQEPAEEQGGRDQGRGK